MEPIWSKRLLGFGIVLVIWPLFTLILGAVTGQHPSPALPFAILLVGLAMAAIGAVTLVMARQQDPDIAFRMRAIAAVGEAFKTNGRSIDINTAEGLANLTAISYAVRAAAGDGQRIGQLRATLISSGVPEAAADKLIATYARG